MSIVIFGDLFSFPDGLAATNRIYTYAKGFQENGIDVHVICFSNNYMDEPDGVIDGISYYNPFGQKKRSRYFIVRRWEKLMKYRKTYVVFKKIRKKGKIIAINRWSDTPITQFFAWILAKLFRTKVITECNEHPLRYHQGGERDRKIGVIKFYIDSYLSSGILCISKYLISFHKKRGIKDRKLFLVPSTVDPSRFIQTGSKPINQFYIGYFGSLTFKRDNIDLLINAFAQVSNLHSSIKLILGGFCNQEERNQIIKLINDLNITSKVQIIEYLTRQEIVRYITHADILVMVRSKDIQSEASYPSKLTEYLATGKPVISVNVGEISDFLKDGVNALIIEPGNVKELSEKLDRLIKNPAEAKMIGQNGKELTNNIFHYHYQAKRILGFMKSV